MKKIHSLWRYMTIALCGVSTLTIFPSTDYMEHVSTPEQLSKDSWERTGHTLKASMEKGGVLHGKKQSAAQ